MIKLKKGCPDCHKEVYLSDDGYLLELGENTLYRKHRCKEDKEHGDKR